MERQLTQCADAAKWGRAFPLSTYPSWPGSSFNRGSDGREKPEMSAYRRRPYRGARNDRGGSAIGTAVGAQSRRWLGAAVRSSRRSRAEPALSEPQQLERVPDNLFNELKRLRITERRRPHHHHTPWKSRRRRTQDRLSFATPLSLPQLRRKFTAIRFLHVEVAGPSGRKRRSGIAPADLTEPNSAPGFGV